MKDQKNGCECVDEQVQPLAVLKTLSLSTPIVQPKWVAPGIVQESLGIRWLELSHPLVLVVGFQVGVQGSEDGNSLNSKTTFPTRPAHVVPVPVAHTKVKDFPGVD